MDTTIAGLSVRAQGKTGAPILLVAGPPIGAVAFEHVQRRLAPRRTVAVELVQTPPREASIAGLAERLSEVVRQTEASAVVAHGLAVPVALRLSGVRLYISNGPVQNPEVRLRSLANAGQSTLAQLILQPGLAKRWMASSAGLRRTVVNPYVMDRDTVVRISEAVLATADTRQTASAWIKAAAGESGADWAVDVSEVFGIWGDSDPLYPLAQLRKVLQGAAANAPSIIPGGRNMHLIERPWELADRVADYEERLTAT